MSHFLNALWRDALGCGVGICVGYLLRGVIGSGIRRAWRDHIGSQRQIVDALDANTPGGIGDLKRDLPDIVRSVLDERDNSGA